MLSRASGRPSAFALARAFLSMIRASGNSAAEVPYQVLCDGKKVGEGTASLKKGKAVVRMAARSTDPGAHKYELRLLPAEDVRPGNNVAWWWVEVTQGPSVLLVTAFADDPLAAVLRAQGIEVEVVSEPKSLHTGSLSGPRAVVINNVPAHKIASRFPGWPGLLRNGAGWRTAHDGREVQLWLGRLLSKLSGSASAGLDGAAPGASQAGCGHGHRA